MAEEKIKRLVKCIGEALIICEKERLKREEQ